MSEAFDEETRRRLMEVRARAAGLDTWPSDVQHRERPPSWFIQMLADALLEADGDEDVAFARLIERVVVDRRLLTRLPESHRTSVQLLASTILLPRGWRTAPDGTWEPPDWLDAEDADESG